MPVDHLERRPALTAAVGVGQVRLHDQTVAVLHQRMPHEAEHRRGARGLLVEPRIGVGARSMVAIVLGPMAFQWQPFERFSPPKFTSTFRVWRGVSGIGWISVCFGSSVSAEVAADNGGGGPPGSSSCGG